MNIEKLKIKIFADGADLQGILKMNSLDIIHGLTTNPTLMKQAGIKNYQDFSREVLGHVKAKPISFEVFSDDFDEMEDQAKKIASWGSNVYVKIPIVNTKNQSSRELVRKLVSGGIKVNVTALMNEQQVAHIAGALDPSIPSYVSIFAGRIADSGRDPRETILKAKAMLSHNSKAEIIWASTRELFNIIQADNIGCHAITVPNSMLDKLNLFGKNLDEYSLETVKMFYMDAVASGYSL